MKYKTLHFNTRERWKQAAAILERSSTHSIVSWGRDWGWYNVKYPQLPTYYITFI